MNRRGLLQLLGLSASAAMVPAAAAAKPTLREKVVGWVKPSKRLEIDTRGALFDKSYLQTVHGIVESEINSRLPKRDQHRDILTPDKYLEKLVKQALDEARAA